MKTEVQTIFASKLKIATLIAVIILPLIYGALYLWAFWDPYGKLDQIPVAVVNNDQCVEKNQKQVCLGDDLVKKLAENRALDWHFVTDPEAENGLKDKKFYSILYIPKDFSWNTTSVDSGEAKHTNLVIKTRQASNFMVSKFVDTATMKIRASLNESISEEYFNSIFVETRESADELELAVDGAKELKSGLNEATEGTHSLRDGLQSAYDGSVSLNDGLKKLAEGSDDLYNGFSAVQNGKTVNYLQGTIDLATGSAAIRDGATTINNTVLILQAGVFQLASGSSVLVTGSKQVLDGLAQLSSNLPVSTTALDSALTLLRAYAVAHPEASSSAEFQQAVAIVDGTDAGLKTASSASAQLVSGQQQVYGGLVTTNNSLLALQSGASQLHDGTKNLVAATQTLADGANNIKDGSQSLADGAKQMRDNLYVAQSGSSDLSSGLSELNSGSTDLLAGLERISDGAVTLRNKLSDAVAAIFDKTDPQQTKQRSAVMASAVALNDQSIDLVSNNGTGFAPYFMPLALWVGAMAVFFLISPNIKAPITFYKIFDKVSVISIIGVLQAVILNLVLTKVLHLAVLSFGRLMMFSVVMSYLFITIQYFLTMFLADAGKFVAILLLMLQLTSSAGSYPYETLPTFFQKINPFLPMTYCVKALREIISGGDWQVFNQQVLILSIMYFGFILIIANMYYHQRQACLTRKRA